MDTSCASSSRDWINRDNYTATNGSKKEKIEVDAKFDFPTESEEEKSIKQGSNHATEGAAAFNGNAQYVKGNVNRKMVGGNYYCTKNYYGNENPETLKNYEGKNGLEELCSDLKEELELTLRTRNNSTENGGFPIILSKKELQHWTFCNTENFDELSRFIISDEVYEQPSDGVHLENVISEGESDTITVLVGQPKVGKTNLIKTLGFEFLKNKNYDFVFYVNLAFMQERFSKKEIDLFTFLTSNRKNKIWILNEALRQNVLEKIRVNQKLLFIFDDFDSLKLENLFESNVGYFNEAEPEEFVKNILCKEMFPTASIVVVSKPFNLGLLKEMTTTNFSTTELSFVNVLGLNYDWKLQLFKEKIPGSVFLDLNTFIVKDLWSFCFAPCVFNCLLHCCSNNNISSLTSTHIIISMFLRLYYYIRKESSQPLDLFKLANFAQNQFFNEKLCFELTDLEEFLGDSYTRFFFTTLSYSDDLTGLPNFGSKSHFNHIVVHEVLVALNLILSPDNEFKHKFTKLQNIPNNHVVIKFLHGFCNKKIQDSLKHFVSSELVANINNNQEFLNKINS